MENDRLLTEQGVNFKYNFSGSATAALLMLGR